MVVLAAVGIVLLVVLPIIAILMAASTGRNLTKRIELLEAEILRLQQGQSPADASAQEIAPDSSTHRPGPVPRPRIVSTSPPAAQQPGPIPQPRIVSTSLPAQQPDAATAQTTPAEPSQAGPATASHRPAPGARQPRPPKPSRTTAEWEALLGGRVLNRIGALALILGVGFFLKYAFDREWITEEMRTAIGACTGIALLLIGARSHRKGYAVFSQGLVGAGLAVLYLTVFAAFALYDLGISQLVAFILMSGVTVLAFQQAFHYKSVAVSLLGLAGGFLTPLMLSTGSVNAPGLFTYLAILDAGLIAITLRDRQWKILEPLALACTHLYYFIWLIGEFQPPQAATAVIFLGIFWALFLIPDILRARKEAPADREMLVVGTANAVLLFSGMTAIAGEVASRPFSLVSAVIGISYLAMTALLRRGTQGNAHIANRNALIGITVLAIAVWQHPFPFPVQLYRPAVMTLLALALLWWGAARKAMAIWLPALLLFGNALLFAYDAYSPKPLLVAGPVPLLATVIAQFIVVAGLLAALYPVRVIDANSKSTAGQILHYIWPVVMFVAITLLVTHTFTWNVSPDRFAQVWTWVLIYPVESSHKFTLVMTLCIVWSGYALGLFIPGLRARKIPLLHCAIGSLIIACLTGVLGGISYTPIETFVPVLNIRAAALISIVAALLIFSLFMQRHRGSHELPQRIGSIVQTLCVLIFLEFLTVEAADIFNRAILRTVMDAGNAGYPAAAVDSLENSQQMTISGIWILYSAVLMVVGILRRGRPLRVLAFVLFGLTIAKIFILDLSFLDTLYRIFSFIGLGVILLAISFLFQKFRDVIFGADGETNKQAEENPGMENTGELQRPEPGPENPDRTDGNA